MKVRIVHGGEALHVGDRRLRIDHNTHRVARYLHNLGEYLAGTVDPAVRRADLLEAREDFAEIIELRPIAGLVLALDQGNRVTERLAIWLLGKCEARIVTPQIVEFRTASDFKIRCEVARTLRRLAAWTDLAGLQKNDLHPDVRQLAANLAPAPRAFGERLRRFTGEPAEAVASSAPFESPMPLFWDADHFDGKPPKPAWLIRRILERIRQALTGFTVQEK